MIKFKNDFSNFCDRFCPEWKFDFLPFFTISQSGHSYIVHLGWLFFAIKYEWMPGEKDA